MSCEFFTNPPVVAWAGDFCIYKSTSCNGSGRNQGKNNMPAETKDGCEFL